MQLIFMYGPPAVGKLTIAEKLSEISGIALFHNHLSRDIVKDIYPDNLREHYGLVDTIRLDVFEYCAKNGTDLIFTYVYEGAEDDENVKQFVECIEKNGGQVRFVELTASKEDLIARVNAESRKKFKKLTDREKMAKLTQDLSVYSIPYVDAFKIDTSQHTPEESAKLLYDMLR